VAGGIRDCHIDIQCDPQKPFRTFCEEARSLHATIHRVMLTFVFVFVVVIIVVNVFHL